MCQGASDFWIVKLGPDLTKLGKKVEVYPNPSEAVISLKFAEDVGPDVELTVFDFLGKEVFRKNVTLGNDLLSEKVFLPVSKGIYLMKIKAGAQIFTEKIIVE